MFVKVYDGNKMLAIKPLIFEKKGDKVEIKTFGKTITFYSDGKIEFIGSCDYLMCNGECYNATPEGYQDFVREVINKL